MAQASIVVYGVLPFFGLTQGVPGYPIHILKLSAIDAEGIDGALLGAGIQAKGECDDQE